MDDIRTRYLRCWNETDATARRGLIADHWQTSASYIDPMGAAHGAAEIDATIAGVQEAFPGFVFQPIGDVDGHHDVTRFRWGFGPEGAPAVIEGFDVVQVGTDGRISTVTGFLDKVPAEARRSGRGATADERGRVGGRPKSVRQNENDDHDDGQRAE